MTTAFGGVFLSWPHLTRRAALRTLVMLAVVGRPAFSQATARGGRTAESSSVTFVFTSDEHYGITRAAFRGGTNVPAAPVNRALVSRLNELPGLRLPADGGVGAGTTLDAVDFVVVGGDVANRAGGGVQTAAASWAKFDRDYVRGLALRDGAGRRAPLYVVPGNHDLANAMAGPEALRDPASVVAMYNVMLQPEVPLTASRYDPRSDVVHYSRDVRGLHLIFGSLWPDSAERAWMARDLAAVPPTTPVLIFTHDPPAGDAKHFSSPPGESSGAGERFEELLLEHYKDPLPAATGAKLGTDAEQRGLAAFVAAHRNIKAYFHGHSNSNEFYVWRGPDGEVALNTFRVDSPMKGAVSSKDETRLSFQLVSVDTRNMRATVREVLWNAEPAASGGPLKFGLSKTVTLR